MRLTKQTSGIWSSLLQLVCAWEHPEMVWMLPVGVSSDEPEGLDNISPYKPKGWVASRSHDGAGHSRGSIWIRSLRSSQFSSSSSSCGGWSRAPVVTRGWQSHPLSKSGVQILFQGLLHQWGYICHLGPPRLLRSNIIFKGNFKISSRTKWPRTTDAETYPEVVTWDDGDNVTALLSDVTPCIRSQRMFFIWGSGRTEKSHLPKVIHGAVQPYREIKGL